MSLALEKSGFYEVCTKLFFNFAVRNSRNGGIGRPVCRQVGALRLIVVAIEILKRIYVYAISSMHHNYIYVGMTKNLEERFDRHNSGRERTTKAYLPYKIIYQEECLDRVSARKREKYWKSGVGKEQLRTIRDTLIA
ncbi:GIY-YIG nuclease family protein [uncultured Dokdonia sp.]|uniref:GIY-YIG nuclease family protein n=1 Tax=uncultured Dokdonia sp. TaxID=575653 RepID=UPI0026037F6C|nr:GIY-YIG nuclease family protein [uncultured Dokdonia sp.]